MIEQIITILSGSEIWSSLSNNIDVLASVFNKYLSGANNLRIASIILMLLALVLFLFLIIILYVKSIIAFLRADNSSAGKSKSKSESFFNQIDENTENNDLVNELELEKELEKELERELEQARVERVNKERQEQNAMLIKHEQEQKEQENLKSQEIKEELEKENREKAAEAERKSGLDLDWRKGKLKDLDSTEVNVSPEILQYKQSRKTLSELLGLVVDMIGRGVDDLKIAQTLMYRNQGENSEDDILQTIDAVKDFIALCVNGKFEPLKASKKLPEESAALYHLAKEDTSLALAMVESLMDNNIEKSTGVSGAKREEIFMETSNYACLFGSLASISDVHLATSSFELSIELSPNNVNAWSRIGDMYAKTESNNKAIWAYQNLLNMADEEIYPRQVANANAKLSKYYYDQGNSLQAAKLYNSSKQYYDSIGINRRLDKKEVEIIEIIEENKGKDLEATITKILGVRDSRQYSYA